MIIQPGDLLFLQRSAGIAFNATGAFAQLQVTAKENIFQVGGE
jgi:hypothetical protein